jgi:alkylhydroperoxidase family enzyme
MTWIPIDTTPMPERDALLGMQPEVYARLREILTLAWQMSDARLLDLCRLRLAQLVGARAEIAGVNPERLADLEDWRSSRRFTDRERAALSYAEQYHRDHKQITAEQQEELDRHLPPRDLVNFVWALHMNDA